jgi:hypothetical protein
MVGRQPGSLRGLRILAPGGGRIKSGRTQSGATTARQATKIGKDKKLKSHRPRNQAKRQLHLAPYHPRAVKAQAAPWGKIFAR